MTDVSMQGATLVLSSDLVNGDVVLSFSEEGTPIDFPDMETVGYGMNMNGELITWTKPVPVTFRITLIPGTRSDNALRKLLYASHIGGSNGAAVNIGQVLIKTATLTIPKITIANTSSAVEAAGTLKFTFSNGRMTGGNPAMGSNAEGKMTARTYNFVFESMAENRS